MNTDDILYLSLGVNVGLLYLNHRVSKRFELLSDFMARTMVVMKGIAEGKITLKIVGDEVRVINLKENL